MRKSGAFYQIFLLKFQSQNLITKT